MQDFAEEFALLRGRLDRIENGLRHIIRSGLTMPATEDVEAFEQAMEAVGAAVERVFRQGNPYGP
jgi:hypothetical protein